ncbi:B3 domain-containing protein At3g17010 [Elaeis guineensis]|uniref:B3 domain-containing protein Os01g0723500 n=1 Tax=Elaeis guineensis var. tenera TaxID=51953 RepID=A0A6I9QED3_ELAGV|nr:B3 domain-containing protein Os01g0723500 [Elaeis guineensis]
MGKAFRDRASFFKVMMGDFKTSLRIPTPFKKRLRGKLRSKSVLRSARGGIWHVAMRGSDRDGWFFQRGWEAFVADHAVAVGDFLVFVFDGDIGFDVKIYGKNGCEKEAVVSPKKDPSETLVQCLPANPNRPSTATAERRKQFIFGKTSSGTFQATRRPSIKVERESVLEAASSTKFIYPHFIATCRKSRRSYMTIPMALVREFGLTGKQLVILRDPVGSSWPVRIASWRSGRMVFATGWSDFYKGNCLEDGDVCVFEFVQNASLIHVHIFRAKEVAAEMDQKPGECLLLDKKRMSDDDKRNVVQITSSFKSGHSNFIACWRKSRSHFMTVPSYLAREHKLKMKKQTILHDPCGKSWQVKIRERADGRVVLATGWHEFSKGNHLKEGDTCVFEFIRGGNAIQVHIYRKDESNTTAGNGLKEEINDQKQTLNCSLTLLS